jgi:hypothetical protein
MNNNTSTYKVFTGTSFNKFHADKKFFKVTTKSENHRGLQFKTGLITDFNVLNSMKYYSAGIHFCSEDDLHKWILPQGDYVIKNGTKTWVEDANPMHWIRPVTIPPDAIVCVIAGVPKTNKIILGNRTEIWTDYDLCLKCISRCWQVIKYINQNLQTEQMGWIALRGSWRAIQFIRSDLQTEHMAKYAVKLTWCTVLYIRSDLMTESMQIVFNMYGRSPK